MYSALNRPEGGPMLKLAVNHSVISSDALADALQERYDIGDVLNCRFLCNGLNDTYLVVTSEGKYIFRVYKANWRNRGDICFEIELLHHLKSSGIPVSIPVMTRDGDYLTEIAAPEGHRFAVMFTYAEGGASDKAEHCSLYGEHAARMHLAMDDFRSTHERFNIDLDHLLKKPLAAIKPLLAHRLEDVEYLESLSAILQNRIHKIASELEWGVCHGDLHGGNVHFHENTLTHFDFDCGGFGWRAYDISVFLWARVRCKGKDHFKNEMWDAFLTSYLNYKALSEADLGAVPVFVAIREIWLMGLHTGNSRIWGAWQNDEYFNTNLKFLREWCEEHSIT